MGTSEPSTSPEVDGEYTELTDPLKIPEEHQRIRLSDLCDDFMRQDLRALGLHIGLTGFDVVNRGDDNNTLFLEPRGDMLFSPKRRESLRRQLKSLLGHNPDMKVGILRT